MVEQQNTPRHFVSIMGLTVMGFVQSLQAYRLHVGEPEAVHILVTPEAQKLDIDRIMEWYKGQAHYTFPVHTYLIDSDVTVPGGQLPTVFDVYRELEAQYPLAVNLMGGTNLLNCAGVMALEKTDTLFVQVTNDAAILSQVCGLALRSTREALPESFAVTELLKLQNIEWTTSKEILSPLPDICEQEGIAVPQNALWNVIVGGIFWDCVWEDQDNVLHFLSYRNRTATGNRQEDNKNTLSDARKILDFANNKKNTSGLMTRKIIVLEYNANAHRRYLAESHGRITSYHLENHAKRSLEDSIRHALHEAFTSSRPRTLPSKPLPVLTVGTDEPILVVSVGKTDVTLEAIASHKHKHVVLLYTPGDSFIENMIQNMERQKQYFGVKKFYRVACSHDAAEFLRLLAPYVRFAPQMHINSTPGTKGQGAWLTWWAKQNGATVWAIDTSDRNNKCLVCLTEPERSLPFTPMPLQKRLHAYLGSSQKTEKYLTPSVQWGWKPEANDADAAFYEKLLSFLYAWAQAGRKNLFDVHRPFSFDGCNLKHTSENHWSFSWTDNNGKADSRDIDCKDGEWFEKLTAWALAFGVYDRRLNVFSRVRTDVRTDSNGAESFRTDLDVLAMENNGNLYAISCKSGRVGDVPPVLAEIKAVAGTFGRYVRPMYCGLYEHGCVVRDGVVAFGMDTLGDMELLSAALELAEQYGRESGKGAG